MIRTQLVEVLDRLDDAVWAGIPDVVVGDRHDVDPSLLQARHELRIEGEREPVRMPAEGVDGRPSRLIRARSASRNKARTAPARPVRRTIGSRWPAPSSSAGP
jgi:hypothetical protein